MPPTDPPSEVIKRDLVAAARAAVTKAFLTKEGGVRYGAAVLTASGRVFSSGQYSSFNHSTNVHAEQGSLVLASMHGDPDVVMLAVASSGIGVTRPCGVCRQVMLEHASRTGRNFTVLMAADDGGHVESTVSDLLPDAWASHSASGRIDGQANCRCGSPSGGLPMQSLARPLLAGDQVRLTTGELAIVWDGNPWPGAVLVKLKYRPDGAGTWRKYSHAFTEPYAYERELLASMQNPFAPCGATIASVPPLSIEEVFPMQPVEELSDEILTCLAEADLQAENLHRSGSRAIGLADGGSDHDWVLRADHTQASSFVHAVSSRLRAGRFATPSQSGTLALLGRIFPGGYAKILAESRYAGTFGFWHASHSIMMVPTAPAFPLHGENPVIHGHAVVSGRVICANDTHYKRAGFRLKLDDGNECRVQCYHKAANLVREGDRLAARGWLMEEAGGNLLLQFHAHRDNLVWFHC